MKKRAISLFLALVMTFAVFVTGFTTSASADNENRNWYSDLDHSYDEVILEALLAGVTDFSDAKYGLSKATYARHIQYVQLTHPEVIGIEDIYYEYLLVGNKEANRGYHVVYSDNCAQERAELEARLPEVRAEIDALVPEGATDLQKVLIAHDYIASTTAYDKVPLDNGTESPYIYSAYGVFVKHYAVCQGISLAFKYLMDYLGVECALAESNKACHAWNLVKLDGKWYHLDITADDMWYDILGRVEHEYFLLSTSSVIAKSNNRADFAVVADDYNLVFTDDTCALNDYSRDGQYWSDSRSVTHVYNGSLYYVNSNSELCKDGSVIYVPDEYMSWHPFGNRGAVYTAQKVYAKIAANDNIVYMNAPRGIYKIDLDTADPETGKVAGELIWAPEECAQWVDPYSGEVYPMPDQIFGLSRIEGVLYCSIEQDVPNRVNETWTPVPGVEKLEYEITDPPVVPDPPVTPDPIGFVSGSSVVSELSAYVDMGRSASVTVSGIPEGASVSAESSNPCVAACSFSGNTLTVNGILDGTANITVMVNDKALTLRLTVNKIYSAAKNVSVEVGKSVTLSDETGNYQSTYTAMLLDTSVASAAVKGTTQQSTPATAASVTKLGSYANGSYLIGASNGKYLVRSGSSLSTTTDPAAATKWTFSGSASSFTVSADGYYLVHSTSGVSLSASSSNGSWQYSSSKGFYFTQSKKVIFSTKTTTYYLNSSFGVGTSSSNLAYAYSFVPGTPEVPGKNVTDITFTGVSVGNTQVIVGSTLYMITVTEPVYVPVYQTVTVYSVDDAGKTVAAPYQITGEAGTSYTVTPSAIANYNTPAAVSGKYTDAQTASVTLVYVLNTDKSALKSELDSEVSADAYTSESYNAYSSALSAGRTVYNNARAMQTEVDSAVQNIRNAKAKLAIKPAAAYSLDTNGIDSGNKYVIINNGRALAVVNGKLTAVAVSVSGNDISSVDSSCVWTVTASGSGYTLKNDASGKYLSYTTSGLITKKCSLGVSSSASAFTGTLSGTYIRFSVKVNSSNTFYLSGGSSFSMAKNSTSNANMAMYKKN